MPTERHALIRQWYMLRLVPRYPGKIPARSLREALVSSGFDITKRTVERDLNELSVVFPLTVDTREKPYGWSWQKDAPSFDLPGMSATEALTVKLVQEYLRPLLPLSVSDQLTPHFKAADKALSGLPHASRAASWTRKIRIVFPTQPLLTPAIRPNVQREVYEALLQDRQIATAYRRRGEEKPVEYTLHPLAIVQRGAVTYLVATVFNYDDIHLFALHRFDKATVLDVPVCRPPGFDLDKYVASGAFGFGKGCLIRLQALLSREAAEHLYETPLCENQILKPRGDTHVKLTATVADTPQLRWWLLGFGNSAEVLAPATLRSEIASAVLEASRLYRQ